MSNNIVQLVDKDSNNIFPIAGSMAADSITTAMIQDESVTPEKIGVSVSTVSATMKAGSGSDTTVTLNKIPLGGNLYILSGIVHATASSVTSGSRTNIKLTLPDDLVTSCLGGAVSVYQNAQAASYTQYARLIPSSGNIDASCMCGDSTNTVFWLNYLAIVTIGS